MNNLKKKKMKLEIETKASVLQDTLWSVLQNCPFLSCQEYWKSTCTLECQKSTLLVLKK